MVVPPYCRSRQGHLFRLLRSSELVTPDRMRYVLRAQPVNSTAADPGLELAIEVDVNLVRDKIAHRHVIPTPESTYEDLWQRLAMDLDSHYG